MLVKDIGQLVSVAEGQAFLTGKDMTNIKIKQGKHAVAVDDEGKIAMVGLQEEVSTILEVVHKSTRIVIRC